MNNLGNKIEWKREITLRKRKNFFLANLIYQKVGDY